MGGSSQTQTSSAETKTQPWQPTIGPLQTLLGKVTDQIGNQGLTGGQTNALGTLQNLSSGPNQFLPQINETTNNLLSGGPDRTGYVTNAYNNLNTSLLPYTTMDTNPYSNPAFVNATNTMSNDITDRIKSAYAGAGYSPVRTGDFAQQLGRGITQGIAPTWLQAYNDLQNQKTGAINTLYNAGNTTAGALHSLDQASLNNQLQGINASNAAIGAQNLPYENYLKYSQLQQSLPLQNLAAAENLIVPMAQLGGTTNSNQTTTKETNPSLGQQILGGITGGLGILGSLGGFGPAGFLTGGSGLLGNMFGGGYGVPMSLNPGTYGGIGLPGYGGLY